MNGLQDERYRVLIARLRQQRLARKLTQQGLAERLGRRQQFVSKYESFERRLDVIEFVDIARELNLDWARELQQIEPIER
ncbi:helix-turn-helix domain-containing protein [Sphingomonas yabuuchiae]|uniref:helix-turn-helix domain-containing protein n=1 Tax=Sphingomonas yabuuchiae TaxID=172044 RepID=UPI003D96A91C